MTDGRSDTPYGGSRSRHTRRGRGPRTLNSPIASVPRRRRRASAVRASARLAVRQVGRLPGSSALVVLLIALPMMALTFGLAVFESHQPAPEDVADYSLGGFDARISAVAPTGTAVTQDGWDDTAYDLADPAGIPTGSTATRPELPAGAGAVEIRLATSRPVNTAGGIGAFPMVTGTVGDARFAGAFNLVDGRTPRTSEEVAVTSPTLSRLGVAVGDQIHATDEAVPPVTITGVISSLQFLADEQILFAPADSLLIPDGETAGAEVAVEYGGMVTTRWYVADWTPEPSDMAALNAEGYTILARNLLHDADAERSFDPQDSARTQAYLLGAAGGVFVCILVGLVARAAIAVSARRQQRTLAMIASVGASRGDLFGIVLGQALVLGVLSAAAGIGAGAGLAAVVLPLTAGEGDDVLWRYWGFHLPPAPLALIATLAVVVALAAAVVPAVAATRGDTIGALRGARRPPRLSTKLPLWGLVVALSGFGGAAAAVVLLTARRDRELTTPHLLLVFSLILLAVVTTLIGLSLCGHWIFVALSRLTIRAGVATRLAARDASASPSRTVPAVLAIAAAVLVGTIALSYTAVTATVQARLHTWYAPPGSVYITSYGESGSAETRAEEARTIQETAQSVAHTAIATVSHTNTVQYDWEGSGAPIDPAQRVGGTGWYDPECEATGCTNGWAMTTAPPAVIATDDLPVAIGVALTPDQRDAYEHGAAIVRSDAQTQDGQTRVFAVTAAAVYDRDPGITPTDLSASILTPAIVLPHAQTLDHLIIAPSTAARLGLVTEVTATVVVPKGLWTDEMTDGLSADVSRAAGDGQNVTVIRQSPPPPGTPWMMIFSAIAGVIVVGSATVTLGLGRFERRADDATLAAVGGPRAVRRRVNAVQAVLVVGIGCVSGAVLGLVPSIALVMSNSLLLLRDIPLLWIAGLTIGLPLLLAAIAWLVPPRHADLTRRTVIA